MSRDVIEEFETSLRGTVSATERVDPGGFAGALDDHVESPAVGVPLGFEGVSYEGTAVEPLSSAEDLRTMHTGVTPAGVGIADYGTVTVRSTPGGDEPVSVYPERHVAVLAGSDVVPDMATAFERFGEEIRAARSAAPEGGSGGGGGSGDDGPGTLPADPRRTHVMETGPSSTADMGSLVEGVHGPKEVHVLILEGR